MCNRLTFGVRKASAKNPNIIFFCIIFCSCAETNRI